MKAIAHLLAASLLVLSLSAAAQTKLTPAQYAQDVEYFWQTVNDNYAYFDQKQTDWARVHAVYRPQADTLSSRRSLVRLLETMLGELYDHHAGLGTNQPDSRRLVPSATDVYAQWQGGRAVVVDVRRGFGAERVGVRPGAEIVQVEGVLVEQAIRPYLAQNLKSPDEAARNYALNLLLAGAHNAERRWLVRTAGTEAEVLPDRPQPLLENIRFARSLESRRIGSTGYLKINNSLGDNALIPAFDSALTALQDTKALILDLRETPSGGNTTVARAILSRFITREQYYQQHELVGEERAFGVKRKWVELVTPRGQPYTRPVVLLAGRWTGSMGEGLAIAFDGMKRATVLGTELARLNGAIYSFRLPNSRIGFSIPTEKLYHVDGTPRENYVPKVPVPPAASSSTHDVALAAALRRLR
ncbi:S41 family peptidase [Hymenobacter sp. CRA2]|uniref:S41 family peptidase n=1 Tax=Hymenobacter sp. CRA2 TaxID=1955620 RepID=UPI00098FF4F9|nr:S41 family peptidase [Hymenobacter sp. CRA2]OON67840.1 hypothetical protein B0919_16805 [Hymenobacter sp. CRA2]